MRTLSALALLLQLAASPAFAQATPSNAPGTDSMSRETHPASTSMSAPEAASRSDSSVDAGARGGEIANRHDDAPNKVNKRPDQQK